MKNIKIMYILFISCVSVSIISCKKFVDIGAPKNQLVSSQVFADSTGANAAIVGIYSSMMQLTSFGLCSGGLTLYPGLSSDEMNITGTDATTLQFYNYQLNSSNSINQGLWQFGYKYIYQANACIEGISASTNITDHAKTTMIAEAKFLRAFYYFNLINLYGSVPLITVTDYNFNQYIPRSSAGDIYTEIIKDLKFAQANLPVDPAIKSRANFYSATSLLAKVYLYTGQYSLAVPETDKIINSGKYTMVNNLSNVFLSGSTESIMYLLPVVPLHATWEGYYFVPTSTTAKPKYIITPTLYNSFETGDGRKTNWVKTNTASGVIYPYPYKYKINTTSVAATEYSVIFRLAEIYLIRSESKANTGDIAGSIADLNIVRKRAGLANSNASDKATLLLALEKERQAELFCEWGNRWFDLKRTGRASIILGGKTGWTGNAVLYPVPLSELNTNSFLTQNTGY